MARTRASCHTSKSSSSSARPRSRRAFSLSGVSCAAWSATWSALPCGCRTETVAPHISSCSVTPDRTSQACSSVTPTPTMLRWRSTGSASPGRTQLRACLSSRLGSNGSNSSSGECRLCACEVGRSDQKVDVDRVAIRARRVQPADYRGPLEEDARNTRPLERGRHFDGQGLERQPYSRRDQLRRAIRCLDAFVRQPTRLFGHGPSLVRRG